MNLAPFLYSCRAQKSKEQEPVDPILYANSSVAVDWLVKKETPLEDQSIADWTTVSPPMGNIMLLGSRADDFEALGAGNHEFYFKFSEKGLVHY